MRRNAKVPLGSGAPHRYDRRTSRALPPSVVSSSGHGAAHGILSATPRVHARVRCSSSLRSPSRSARAPAAAADADAPPLGGAWHRPVDGAVARPFEQPSSVYGAGPSRRRLHRCSRHAGPGRQRRDRHVRGVGRGHAARHDRARHRAPHVVLVPAVGRGTRRPDRGARRHRGRVGRQRRRPRRDGPPLRCARRRPLRRPDAALPPRRPHQARAPRSHRRCR